jgi:hypothetical protein
MVDRKGSSQQHVISKVVKEVSNQDGSSQVPVDGFRLLGNGILCKEVETKYKTIEKRRDMKTIPSCISTSEQTNVPLLDNTVIATMTISFIIMLIFTLIFVMVLLFVRTILL